MAEKLESGLVNGKEIYEVSRTYETSWKITVGDKVYRGDSDKVIKIRNNIWKELGVLKK